MKVVVIGSGLVGLTSAWFLTHHGHDVTVIDRAEGPGRETSFANGSLLTPSMSDPWNAPGCWRVLLSSLSRSDASLKLHFRHLPAMAGWGLRFLRESRPVAYERNTLSNLRLALYSLEVLKELRETTGIEYGRGARGALKIFRGRESWDHAWEVASRLKADGLICRRLGRDATIELEPALEPIAASLVGGIHYGADETGNAFGFCTALAAHAQRLGVTMQFGTTVSSLEVRSGQVTAVVTERQRHIADAYVVAAGSFSSPLLRRIGIHLPIEPAKGYSVTFKDDPDRASLGLPVIDDDVHAAIVPLEGAIRVAGTAEFAGYDRSISPKRVANLSKLLTDVLPLGHYQAGSGAAWCGLRAMSADGVPIIGKTAIANLYVNSGHGHLGWTMAAGAGRLLADVLSDETPEVDPGPYALARFSRA